MRFFCFFFLEKRNCREKIELERTNLFPARWYTRTAKLKIRHRMEVNEKMRECCRVRLIVEKEEYAREGVHKGMDGIICDPRHIEGCWLVSFDQYGALPEIACIPVKEEDLELMYDPFERDEK